MKRFKWEQVIFIMIIFTFWSSCFNTVYGSQNEKIVSNSEELIEAVKIANGSTDGFTIFLKDGNYNLKELLLINSDHITIQSLSDDYNKVTIQGEGMEGQTTHIFLVAADYFTLEGIGVGNVANHAIQIQGEKGADYTTIKNCRIFDSYEQLLKISGGADKDLASRFGLIENCLFEYTKGIGPQWYVGGIDAHQGDSWTIRGNTLRYIRSPETKLAEHAIHFWSNSMNTVVEGNTIFDCDRGIGFGLGDSKHFGGIIRNNFVHTSRDVGIGLENAAGAKIYNNTVFTKSYENSIEYRFTGTRVEIENNLTNKGILNRDNGIATLKSNITNGQESWFFDAEHGDLHLKINVASVIDKGQNLANIKYDIDGDLRPRGLGYDIGADEITQQQIEPSSWAKDSIDQLKEWALIDEKYFRNYKSGVTRKEFAYLAVRLFEKLSGGSSPTLNNKDYELFMDTKDIYVLKAYRLGIVKGYEDGTFRPDDLINREQTNVMLIEVLKASGIFLNPMGINEIKFIDESDISSWALSAMKLSYNHKIMYGIKASTIAPKMNITREQALFLIQNIVVRMNEFDTYIPVKKGDSN